MNRPKNILFNFPFNVCLTVFPSAGLPVCLSACLSVCESVWRLCFCTYVHTYVICWRIDGTHHRVRSIPPAYGILILGSEMK
jgi:hypothetical protein